MIGELKQRVTLQKTVRTPDGGGGFTEQWQDLPKEAEVYAAIMPLSGGERLRFHQLQASVTHRVTIRYRTDVTAAMRLLHNGIAYDIRSVHDRDGRGVYLEILAEERRP